MCRIFARLYFSNHVITQVLYANFESLRSSRIRGGAIVLPRKCARRSRHACVRHDVRLHDVRGAYTTEKYWTARDNDTTRHHGGGGGMNNGYGVRPAKGMLLTDLYSLVHRHLRHGSQDCDKASRMLLVSLKDMRCVC